MERGQEKLTKEWVEPDYEMPTGNDSTAAEHPVAPNMPQSLREQRETEEDDGNCVEGQAFTCLILWFFRDTMLEYWQPQMLDYRFDVLVLGVEYYTGKINDLWCSPKQFTPLSAH